MKSKYFTLIEILVAVSIFVIAVVISLAIMVNLIRNRSTTATSTNVQLSGNLAMETMVNAIESATTSFSLNGGILSVPIGGKTYAFSRYTDSGNYIGMTVSGPFGTTGKQRLTAPDVNVESLNFSGVFGSTTTKNYVTIDMTLQSAFASSDGIPLTLHTTVIAQL